jgi:hypothetical protein
MAPCNRKRFVSLISGCGLVGSGDPMGVLLCLDYYAMRAAAPGKLLQLQDSGKELYAGFEPLSPFGCSGWTRDPRPSITALNQPSQA